VASLGSADDSTREGAIVAFIGMIQESEPAGEAAEVLASERDRMGYVPNYAAAFAHRPAIYRAWQQLNGAIKESMDLRTYELATVGAARQLRSSYCMLAHSGVLARDFLGPDRVRELALDHRSAGLEPVDVAVMDLAEKVAADATSVTEADIDRLRAFGLSDADILSVVAAASVRCFFSKTLDALGVQADAVYESVEPGLRCALVVGRPIASK
jgi:uncharacterized peroxidase-related enzyme